MRDTAQMATTERFSFGKNWTGFVGRMDDEAVDAARDSLTARLGNISGLSFIDVGSGSGLFTLAAARLGAQPVVAFDYDADSVAMTRQLAGDHVRVEQGDALDEEYIAALGAFDVVYSWGVLHHTGDMWRAVSNVQQLVKPNGRFWLALYRDQGWQSRAWRQVKRLYNRLPALLRAPYAAIVMGPFELAALLAYARRGELRKYIGQWRGGWGGRGMNRWNDAIDWVGGYPFEVASPEAVAARFPGTEWRLKWLSENRRWGCNEYLYRRVG
jgi:2-polyprenyl-6-hydroxyphenyl methylase/3-demethylubiquinone-9 3-methyltransferase